MKRYSLAGISGDRDGKGSGTGAVLARFAPWPSRTGPVVPGNPPSGLLTWEPLNGFAILLASTQYRISRGLQRMAVKPPAT